MKYALICFVFIILISCRFKGVNQGNNQEVGLSDNSPQNTDFIMQEYPWYLDMEVLTLAKADSLFNELETKHGYKLSDVVIDAPKVKIKYRKSLPDFKWVDKSFYIDADNGRNFTAREVLFKINQHTAKDLKGESHCFMEGLEFDNYENEVPVYSIAQGS